MSAAETEVVTTPYLSRWRHCPHCFEPVPENRTTGSLFEWYKGHTSGCIVCVADPDDKIKGLTVKRCEDCGIKVHAGFIEEHKTQFCALLKVASDAYI